MTNEAPTTERVVELNPTDQLIARKALERYRRMVQQARFQLRQSTQLIAEAHGVTAEEVLELAEDGGNITAVVRPKDG